MSDNETLLVLDRAVQGALHGELLDEWWANQWTLPLGRGDLEKLRLMEQVLDFAVTPGYHAVVADASRRGKQ
jgi:hypothetical protein